MKDEKSLNAVEDGVVVCDKKTVKVEDEVKFVYGGKIYDGVVKLMSGKFLGYIFINLCVKKY